MCPYALEPGQKNVDWVEKIDSIIGPATRSFIKANGLKRGMKVLEIVSGPGVLLPWLSEKVGPEGHVFASDPLEAQVEAALRRVRKHNLKNVTCLHALHSKINLPPASIDIIFGRNAFVYACKPKAVIAHLYSLLKPGGILIVDEPIVGTTQLCPPAPCIEIFNEKILELGKKQGANYHIAPALAILFRRAGLAVTRHQFHTQRMSLEDIAQALYPHFVTQVRSALVENKIMSEEEIDAFLIELQSLNSNVYTHGNLATHVRIVATKPATSPEKP